MINTITEHEKLITPFIDDDKSYDIRMAVLETFYGDPGYALEQLDSIAHPSDDIRVLEQIILDLPTDKPLDVGESGTLARIFSFSNWKQSWGKQIIKHGTLISRDIATEEEVLACSNQTELLHLRDRTSQWATAAVLIGDPERISNPPYKLGLTYDVWDEWHEKQQTGERWVRRLDETLFNQALHIVRLIHGEDAEFEVKQAEDVPHGYVFGEISIEEADQRFPSLRGHESNRIAELPLMLNKAVEGQPVDSRDHRVVQALAFFGLFSGIEIEFVHPACVSKSWPQYWNLYEVLEDTYNKLVVGR